MVVDSGIGRCALNVESPQDFTNSTGSSVLFVVRALKLPSELYVSMACRPNESPSRLWLLHSQDKACSACFTGTLPTAKPHPPNSHPSHQRPQYTPPPLSGIHAVPPQW